MSGSSLSSFVWTLLLKMLRLCVVDVRCYATLISLSLSLSVRLTCAACALVYIKIETGTCTSHGYKRLANAAECGAAAKAVSGGDKGFNSALEVSDYAACYYYSTNSGIYFGSGTHSVGQDGETPCNVISGMQGGRTASCYCLSECDAGFTIDAGKTKCTGTCLASPEPKRNPCAKVNEPFHPCKSISPYG